MNILCVRICCCCCIISVLSRGQCGVQLRLAGRKNLVLSDEIDGVSVADYSGLITVRFWIEACELVCRLQLWKGRRPLDKSKQQGGNQHLAIITYHILM